ncbi:carbohydrate porin [Rhodomicrobium vannielii]|uniref:carbohydrate porin n=1 Tax=Rhodomicrobium vannielii TaxID=1069 RepID=UPI001FEFE2E3|nr:carbohydrate porin [Rhodomicrobium vannielii]
MTGCRKSPSRPALNGGPDASARAALAAKGITYGINYIGETFTNSGGAKDGSIYQGRLEVFVDADLEKLAGLKGLTFHANGYQIHGKGLSDNLGGPLMAISSIEAEASTRLFELWLEQKFGERVSVRAGQLAVDSEFFTTETGGAFINSTFGWAGIWAADVPQGGNAYPLATPGARVQVDLTDALTFRAAIYNGSPANPNCEDPQACNDHGTDFRTQDDPFLVQEIEYKYNQAAKGGAKDGGYKGYKDFAPAPSGITSLPGTIKFGSWQHTQEFEAVNGSGKLFDANYGFYGSIDQQIYALPDDPTKGVNVFARLAGAPTDRNAVDFYFDGGVVFSGFIPSRPDDSFGAGFAYASISDDAIKADSTLNYESMAEIFYKAQIVPGLTIQPDLQYMWNVGGVETGGEDAIYGGVRISVAY